MKETIYKNNTVLTKLLNRCYETDEITTLILNTIKTDPPALTKKGGYIRRGFSSELDELEIRNEDYQWIIPDGTNTNTAESSTCTYDRMIIGDGGSEEYLGSFSTDCEVEASDHCIISAEFSLNFKRLLFTFFLTNSLRPGSYIGISCLVPSGVSRVHESIDTGNFGTYCSLTSELRI